MKIHECYKCKGLIWNSARKYCSEKCMVESRVKKVVVQQLSKIRKKKRKSRYSNLFKTVLSKLVKENANYVCQDCGDTNLPMETHHIDNNNKNDNLDNLIALCIACHASRHPSLNFILFESKVIAR